MIKNKLRISFKLASKPNLKCEHYITGIIRINDTQTDFRTGLSCLKKNWYAMRPDYVVKSEPKKTEKLRKIVQDLEKIMNELTATGKKTTAQIIFSTYNNALNVNENNAININQKPTCLQIFDEWAEIYQQNAKVKLITYDSYRRILSYQKILNDFLLSIDKTDILVDDFPRNFFEKIKIYLLETKKFGINHTAKILASYKNFLEFAFNNDYVKKNVFKGLSLKKVETDVICLNKKELEIIENKVFSTDRLEKIKNIFLFSCYTGLAFVDVSKLSKNHIKLVEGRHCIEIHREKTKNFCFVPLMKKAYDILEKYNFSLNLPTNQKYNEYLKEIQNICQIDKKLTTHVARKTFINVMISNYNIDLTDVAKMVGHTSVKTTQKYYIEKETMKMNILNVMKNIQ